MPAATVYLTKILVDRLTEAVGGGLSAEALYPVLIPTLAMGSILLATQLLGGLLGWVRVAQSELVQDYIKGLIHRKAATVDLAFFETPEESDRMSRANSEASSRSLSLLQNIGILSQNLVTLIAVALILVTYSFWIPLLLFLSTLPALWVVLHHNNLHHNWWEKTTEDRRWTLYYDRMLTMALPAAEMRLFGLGASFQHAYKELRRTLRESRLRLLKRQNVAQVTASISALFVTAGSLVWMAARAFKGLATIGDIALFYQAFNQGQQLMRSLLNSVGQLYGDALFLEHLFTFLDQKSEVKSPPDTSPIPASLSDGIHFKHVTFCYPGSDKKALNDFSLHIPAGKTVALVGPNGAGKTTITKLLCRFYDPTQGVIEIDGVDIRKMDLEALRRNCAVLFQHPMRYIATAGRNISIGDLDTEPSLNRIHEAAVGGGAHDIISALPQKYDTLLGKQFRGGVELSGGQWQRVTLSRAFFRNSPIVILDEPTSFMDSWAETRWLDRFRTLVKNRTAIIVTHRFTTAMRADIICVVEDGRIVEMGGHEDLVRQGGLYASSWNKQIQVEDHTSFEAIDAAPVPNRNVGSTSVFKGTFH